MPLDTIEVLAWGSNLDWGFNKHPPMSAFFPEVFFQIFGSQDWVYYLLSQIFVIIAFYYVFKFALEIFGDIKLIISCDIINPAKWVTANDTSNPLNPLEVGSIIDFDNTNMFPKSPMGYNSSSWSGIKFMITSMTRKLGLISIKAREILKD